MIPGLHHVTAIASDAQANLDFYAGVLGLRLVKRTVNFDDPRTYHLYYGTELGAPGTILTFFAWPGAFRGQIGTGQVNVTALSVPRGSLAWWTQRLREKQVVVDEPAMRFGEETIGFADPDGMRLELIATADARAPWSGGAVPAEHAIRGTHGVTMCAEGYERTAQMLTDVLGFRQTETEGARFRYVCGDGGAGAFIDVVCKPDAPHARSGAGTVHHIAWRAPDGSAQKTWRETVARAALNVSPILDRQYFQSIYFREPGGVLFEIATDEPGFAIDEPAAELGATLRLPPWLEAVREQIESSLPPLKIR